MSVPESYIRALGHALDEDHAGLVGLLYTIDPADLHPLLEAAQLLDAEIQDVLETTSGRERSA